MFRTRAALIALSLLVASAARVGAKPDRRPCDMGAIATAQLQLVTACPCETASNHGQYVRCVVAWTKQALADGTLPRACKKSLRKGAARSTCGKPHVFVTCCRGGDGGATSCSIKTASVCTRLGGTLGVTSSCLDACLAPGSPSGAFLASVASAD
jgi:hypothetical protein